MILFTMLFPILADMSGCTPWTFHGDRSNSYFNYATPNVLTACSGREALNLAANSKLDVILLDMMIPDMDERATLQKLKANPITKSIPVILLTAKVQESDQKSFTGLDVVAVFAKPFRPLKLAAQIREVLGWN